MSMRIKVAKKKRKKKGKYKWSRRYKNKQYKDTSWNNKWMAGKNKWKTIQMRRAEWIIWSIACIAYLAVQLAYEEPASVGPNNR